MSAPVFGNQRLNGRGETSGDSMNCEQFQDQLPEFFERGAELQDHPHLRDCEQCAALVRDLEYIAQQAKLLLPIHEPSPNVWNNIQTQLGNENKRQASGAK